MPQFTLLAMSALVVAGCGGTSAARWNDRGNEAFDKHQYTVAQDSYQQALAAQPAHAQTLYNLGDAQNA